MPGQIQRSLQQALYEIANRGSVTAPQTPGQVLLDVLALVGGLTTAGSALGTATAGSVTWLAVGTGTQTFTPSLTGLANEVGRVPVIGSALSDGSTVVMGLMGASIAWGWLTEMGAFGGSASAANGSGTLYAYCPIARPYIQHALNQTLLQWSQT